MSVCLMPDNPVPSKVPSGKAGVNREGESRLTRGADNA